MILIRDTRSKKNIFLCNYTNYYIHQTNKYAKIKNHLPLHVRFVCRNYIFWNNFIRRSW